MNVKCYEKNSSLRPFSMGWRLILMIIEGLRCGRQRLACPPLAQRNCYPFMQAGP